MVRWGRFFVFLVFFIFVFQASGLVFASNTTELVSLSSTSNQSNSFSYESSLSADGRFVVFTSEADNLVVNDTNSISDVFVRDLVLNKTDVVSLSHNGSLCGGVSPSVSGDGRFVVFVSSVFHDSEQRLLSQVLLRDRLLNVTKLVSVNDKGEMANQDCIEPVISENGLVVAFSTWATNLAEGMEEYAQNIFVRDLSSNKTERVSWAYDGSEPNSSSCDPSISADGQFIAFTSFANNLVPYDTNHAEDVFVRDRINNITERISLSSNGSEANRASFQPSISADGSLIAFTSQANNLIPYDNNVFRDVYVRDRDNNITVRVSETVLGEGADLESMDPCISPDGRYVAFNSGYRDLVASTTPGTSKLYLTNNNNTTTTLVANDLKDYRDVFVKDLFTGDIWKVSNPLAGIEANDHSYAPSISRGGTRVSYTSGATDLVTNDGNEYCDIYSWGTNTVNFDLTGYLSPISVQGGKQVKITAFTSTVAEKVTAYIKNTTIDLKFLNGSWEGYYLVPVDEKAGKQTVNLEAISTNGNNANLSLFFNVITVLVNPPKPPIVPIKTVTKPSTIKKVITPSKAPIKVSITKTSNLRLNLGIKAQSKSIMNIIKKSAKFNVVNSITLGIKGLTKVLSPKKSSPVNVAKSNVKNLSNYNSKSWKYNNKGSVYGPFASIINSPYNPLSYCFYTWDKFIQAGQKAWKTGNIWDFFNYPFYHIYGYSNLDKMWGGENIKFLLSFLFEIDQNGNISIGGLLINVLSLIPLTKVASFGGKFLSKALPKALNVLIKSRSVQVLLKSKAFQGLLKTVNEYVTGPLKWMAKKVVDKFPIRLRDIKMNDMGKWIRKMSDLINLNPKTWIESFASTLKRFKKVGLNVKLDKWLNNSSINRAASKIHDKIFLGKITRKDVLNIVDGSIKLVKDGLKGGFDFIKGILTKMDSVSVKYWVHRSPWRMKNMAWLKTITSKNLYKDVHGVLSPVIKRNASLRSVYKAAQTITETIKTAPEITKKTMNNLKSMSKNIVKTTKKIITNSVKSSTIKKVIKKLSKSVQKVVHKVNKVVKKVSKSVKKVVHKVKKTIKKFTRKVKKVVKNVGRGFKRVVKKYTKMVKNPISSGIKWLKKKIKWF